MFIQMDPSNISTECPNMWTDVLEAQTKKHNQISSFGMIR